MISALLGALVIASIANGMDLLGLASGTKYIVTGVILLAAVLVDTVSKRRRAAAAASERAMSESIGVGMLGYAFMGKAHSRAFREAAALDPPLVPELVSISGRDAAKVGGRAPGTAGRRRRPTGASRSPTSAIGLFVNGGPNALHAEPTIAAARRQARALREAARPHGRGVAARSGAPPRRRASCTCAASTTASSRPSGSPARSSTRASSASSSTSARATSSRGA